MAVISGRSGPRCRLADAHTAGAHKTQRTVTNRAKPIKQNPV
jgi:hypothetical protein